MGEEENRVKSVLGRENGKGNPSILEGTSTSKMPVPIAVPSQIWEIIIHTFSVLSRAGFPNLITLHRIQKANHNSSAPIRSKIRPPSLLSMGQLWLWQLYSVFHLNQETLPTIPGDMKQIYKKSTSVHSYNPQHTYTALLNSILSP